jgi:hypothetical protein
MLYSSQPSGGPLSGGPFFIPAGTEIHMKKKEYFGLPPV